MHTSLTTNLERDHQLIKQFIINLEMWRLYIYIGIRACNDVKRSPTTDITNLGQINFTVHV